MADLTPVSSDDTTCQVCARTIKSKLGVVAHHGYERPGDGWQTPSCWGARHLAYERSRDLIPQAIAHLEARAATLRARLAELAAGTAQVMNPAWSDWHGYASGNRPLYGKPMPAEPPKTVGPGWVGEGSRRGWNYATLVESARREAERDLTWTLADIATLQARYEAWVLREVVPADTLPPKPPAAPKPPSKAALKEAAKEAAWSQPCVRSRGGKGETCMVHGRSHFARHQPECYDLRSHREWIARRAAAKNLA